MPPSSSSLDPHADYRARRHFALLDGLRAFSILAVVWHHAGVEISGFPASQRGFLGVDLFFVLSGFLIVTLLLRERDAHGAIGLRDFYARRTLRIFPLYYALVSALTVLALVKTSSTGTIFLRELPYYLTYTSNWVPTVGLFAIAWSLAAEEQFYLFWPPIEAKLRSLALPLLGVFFAINQLVNFRVLDLSALGLRYDELNMLQVTFAPMCLGVLLAHLLHDARGFRLAHRAFGHRWSAPLLLVAIVLVTNFDHASIGGLPRLTLHVLLTLLLASVVLREDGWLTPVLAWAPIRYVGQISYGIYLLHLLALHATDALLARVGVDSSWVRFALCTAVVVAVAGLSHRYFERPFLRLKTHFEPGRTHAAPVPVRAELR